MSPNTKNVTDASFEADVLVASETSVVVVDLWAEWCGPCKTLGPILEAAVAARAPRVLLAKIDVDANPMASASFQVQSIPAVFAIANRQVVASFVGAQSAQYIDKWLDELAPAQSPTDGAVAAAIESGNETTLRQILTEQPGHVGAIVGLAQVLLNAGTLDEVEALLNKVPETPQVRTLRARLHQGLAGGAQLGEDEITAKLESLLAQVKADETARASYVELLDLLGPDNPVTTTYRRRLTSALY